jgi:hypothetical protein
VSWSPGEVAAEVLSTPRRAVVRLPDTLVIDRSDLLQIVTPSLRDGGLNEVAFCAFEPAHAEARIDECLARFAAAGVRFRWGAYPDCGPADLPRRLAARGLEASEVVVMTRGLDRRADVDVRGVERVGEQGLGDFTAVMAEGWGVEPGPLLLLHTLAASDPAHALFLARVEGVPAGAGAAVLSARGLYLMGAVVLPRFRDRGVYRALVDARLAHAARAGRTLAYSHAQAGSSAPRLARMGFAEVFRFQSFHGGGPGA